MALLSDARAQYHEALKERIWRLDSEGKPSNADKSQKNPTAIATHMAAALGVEPGPSLHSQTVGREFELVTARFLQQTFLPLMAGRGEHWSVDHVTSRSGGQIAAYAQYSHIGKIEAAARTTPEIRILLGLNYNVASDVVIARGPETDAEINLRAPFVDDVAGIGSALRAAGDTKPTLHACVSCKWTMRSDRAQNVRAEALSLIRNRRGRAPHIVMVTAEPWPSRLASLALGTGDIDCVYHIALPELRAAATVGGAKAADKLELMIEQERIKDIADLPLDLTL